MSNEAIFESAEISHFECNDSSIAYKRFGSGPALIFIHGFPVYGYTWRHLLPDLSANNTCYVLDLPGLGFSKWTQQTDFHFKAQSSRIIDFIKSLELNSCSIIAHDTGATTARLVALSLELTVKTLVLINTEVPNHRPPWIPFYQMTSQLPLSHYFFKASLRNKLFIKSAMGFKEFYANKELLKVESNVSPYIKLATKTNHNMKGALSYLRGCDLKFMDSLKDKHKEIKARVVLIWGEEDKTFPVSYGEELHKQFTNAAFFRIKNASLMPHEEKPKEVLAIIKSELH